MLFTSSFLCGSDPLLCVSVLRWVEGQPGVHHHLLPRPQQRLHGLQGAGKGQYQREIKEETTAKDPSEKERKVFII